MPKQFNFVGVNWHFILSLSLSLSWKAAGYRTDIYSRVGLDKKYLLRVFGVKKERLNCNDFLAFFIPRIGTRRCYLCWIFQSHSLLSWKQSNHWIGHTCCKFLQRFHLSNKCCCLRQIFCSPSSRPISCSVRRWRYFQICCLHRCHKRYSWRLAPY